MKRKNVKPTIRVTVTVNRNELAEWKKSTGVRSAAGAITAQARKKGRAQ